MLRFLLPCTLAVTWGARRKYRAQVGENLTSDVPANGGESLTSLLQKEDWDAWGNSLEGGVGAVQDGVDLAGGDTSVGRIGSLLTNAGAFASNPAFGPKGALVGGILGTAGGILGLFGGGGGPSNQDIMNAIANGFAKVGRKLDSLASKLNSLRTAVAQVQRTADQILNLVQNFYQDFRMRPFDSISSAFTEAISRMRAVAQSDPNTVDYGYLNDFVRNKALEYAQYNTQYFSVSYVNSTVELVRQYSRDQGDPYMCDAVQVYQRILVARWELYWILFMSATLRNVNTERLAEDLSRDIAAFDAAFTKRGNHRGFGPKLLQASDEAMSKGRAKLYKYKVNLQSSWNQVPSSITQETMQLGDEEIYAPYAQHMRLQYGNSFCYATYNNNGSWRVGNYITRERRWTTHYGNTASAKLTDSNLDDGGDGRCRVVFKDGMGGGRTPNVRVGYIQASLCYHPQWYIENSNR